MTDPKTGTALRMGDPKNCRNRPPSRSMKGCKSWLIEPCMQVDDPTRNG